MLYNLFNYIIVYYIIYIYIIIYNFIYYIIYYFLLIRCIQNKQFKIFLLTTSKCFDINYILFCARISRIKPRSMRSRKDTCGFIAYYRRPSMPFLRLCIFLVLLQFLYILTKEDSCQFMNACYL